MQLAYEWLWLSRKVRNRYLWARREPQDESGTGGSYQQTYLCLVAQSPSNQSTSGDQHKPQTGLGIVQALENLNKNNKVILVWVLGDIGIQANGKDDELVKKLTTIETEIPSVGVSCATGMPSFEMISKGDMSLR